MARRNERGLELTFHKASKRWRKVISGKAEHFGSGRGVTDKTSYLAALARYQAFIQAKGDSADFAVLGDVPTSEGFATHREMREAYKAWGDSIANRQASATPQGGTVAALIDDWLVEQGKRYERRQFIERQQGEGKEIQAAKRETISGCFWQQIQGIAKKIRLTLGDRQLDGTEQTAAAFLTEWRSLSEKQLTDGEMSANSFNHNIKIARMFVGWLYETYRLQSLPRNLKQICSKYEYKPTPKAIDLATVRILWGAADERTRAYLALSLNCGFYAVDIATLRREHIKDGYIERDRHKTGVPTRYRLWDVTKTLLERTANGNGSGRVFDGKNGNSLLHLTESGKSKVDAVRSIFWRLCRKCGIEDVTFAHFRDTAATQVERIAPEMTDTFLGHKDHRMAKYYVDRKGSSPLDGVLTELERYFALTLDPPAKK